MTTQMQPRAGRATEVLTDYRWMGWFGIALTFAWLLVSARPADAQTPISEAATPAPQPSFPANPEAPPAASGSSLQQAAANPIGDLTSVPFQYNANFGVGQYGHLQNNLNLQPVVPLDLGRGQLLVWRTIVPLIGQPQLAPGLGNTFGIGDINPQFYYIPHSGRVTFGYGPTFSLPTASDVSLGSGKLSIGPDAALVISSGSTLIGTLVNNVWSIAGDRTRPSVSQFLIQPFVTFNLPRGFSLGTAPTITANWQAPPNRRWTVPLGVTASQLLLLGKQPVQIGLGGFYNVARPIDAAQWTGRFSFTFLFPKPKKTP